MRQIGEGKGFHIEKVPVEGACRVRDPKVRSGRVAGGQNQGKLC